jgi:hypothetical protein
MSHGEVFRRLLTSACNVAALAIILLIAPQWTLPCFVAWKLAMEGAVWLAMQEGRKGRMRWVFAPCVAVAIVLLWPGSGRETTYTGHESFLRHFDKMRP